MTKESIHLCEDQLIDLLGGLLSRTEESESLAHMRGCALCENHFRMLTRERESLRAMPSPRFVGGEIVLPRYDLIHSRPRIFRSRRANWIGAAAVAAAVVTIALATHLFGPSPSDAEDYWLPAPNQVIVPAPESGPPTHMQMAIEAYEDHDPARALALLENVGMPHRNEETEMLRRLYQASALVNDDRPREAQQILDDLDISQMTEPWRARANWVQYLMLRKSDQISRADHVLKELLDEPGEIGEMARRERERLAGD